MSKPCFSGKCPSIYTQNTQNAMKKNFYYLKNTLKKGFQEFCLRKTVFYIVVLFGMVNICPAQDADHDHDTIRIMNRNDFSAGVVPSMNQSMILQISSNIPDSLAPAFIELSVNGFLFTANCIQEQKLNNVSLVSNIEKIWGPEFISLGMGALPPGGTYTANFGLLNEVPTGSIIRIRIFGSVKGQDILWTSVIRK